MKGEIILRRFNKVCKNLQSTTIDEILNDFNKIDSFNSLDEEEKKILVDIMYKFNKLCIKFNIDKKKVMDGFKIESNTTNNNLGLKNSLQKIIYKEKLENKTKKDDEKKRVNQTSSADEKDDKELEKRLEEKKLAIKNEAEIREKQKLEDEKKQNEENKAEKNRKQIEEN